MDQEKPEDSYPNTFVPGRNMVFLTFAAILARGKGIYHLVTVSPRLIIVVIRIAGIRSCVLLT